MSVLPNKCTWILMVFMNFLYLHHPHYIEQDFSVYFKGKDLVIKWCNTKNGLRFKIIIIILTISGTQIKGYL